MMGALLLFSRNRSSIIIWNFDGLHRVKPEQSMENQKLGRGPAETFWYGENIWKHDSLDDARIAGLQPEVGVLAIHWNSRIPSGHHTWLAGKSPHRSGQGWLLIRHHSRGGEYNAWPNTSLKHHRWWLVSFNYPNMLFLLVGDFLFEMFQPDTWVLSNR